MRGSGSGRLRALTPREASIFACLADAAASPEPFLPPVAATDAVPFFDRWVAMSPRRNRLGLRALLYAVEVGPLLQGFHGRLRGLPLSERATYVAGMEQSRHPVVRRAGKLMKGLALFSYYGDAGVLLALGYDSEANVRRGRALRAREGRP